MKKIALAMVLIGCSYGAMANSGAPCADTVATPTTLTDKFIKNAIIPRCSANTYVNFTETTTSIAVGSASKKGKKYFGGSSEGGAVTSKGDCSGTCSATDATAGVTAASSS